jgi:regulation of enolase protein 1 (concanavalin A-like superfamily)
MKNHIILALLALVLPSMADEPTPKKELVEGWGIALNPAEDCKFKTNGGQLTITVPGSEKPHDLSSELDSTTAPRVVQPVKGDFIIEVRVDGEFEPGDQSTQPGRTGYTGAGLVVFADESNFVRIERATLHSTGDDAMPYTNFEIRVNGGLEKIGTTSDLPTEKGKPTWLRLERKGQQILGAMSHDGEHWTYGEPKELRAEAWTRNDIVAGVAAISTSLHPFTPTYSAFSIQQGSKPSAEKIESK